MKQMTTMLSLALLAPMLFASSVFGDCTQGYWKNHVNAWCVGALDLGDVNYTQEELLSILDEEVSGNGLISLAHQLIAAKLNAACVHPPPDCPAIAEADALIGLLVVPPVGGGFLETSVTSPLVDELTACNEDVTFDCPIAVDSNSWGQVKARYR